MDSSMASLTSWVTNRTVFWLQPFEGIDREGRRPAAPDGHADVAGRHLADRGEGARPAVVAFERAGRAHDHPSAQFPDHGAEPCFEGVVERDAQRGTPGRAAVARPLPQRPTAADGHRNLLLTMAVDLSAARGAEVELPPDPAELDRAYAGAEAAE
ncbi:hypothetical protein [Actinomadura sp. 7K507]|uniref:hypothetical protein n=1 Tax=Actinomadura sp. 7K507 TaxID=2530365 RepID=UPI0014049417|nr:hypothetical protein [Actinomadura sp. 7K507]